MCETDKTNENLLYSTRNSTQWSDVTQMGRLDGITDSMDREGWMASPTQWTGKVGWHHRLNGHGFGWTLGVGDGQGSLCVVVHGVTKSWTQLSD